MTPLHSKFRNSYSLLAGILLTFFLIPATAFSQTHFGDYDVNGDVTKRLHHKDAEYAMSTQEGSVDLLVVQDAIMIQFSDRFLEDLKAEIHDSNDENYDEASVLADVIKSMVSSGVTKLLDHAITIPMHEIREVSYEDGRLYIIDKNGDEIFGDLEIDDVDVMEDFSRRNVRRFVSEAERRMI